MRDIELRLTANLDGATKEVAGFTKTYADLVKAVEKPLRQVNAFRDLEASVGQTGTAMRDARDKVRELSAELIKTNNPTRALQESYRNAGRELQRLERLEGTQVAQLNQMSTGLKAAGVDTSNLAREQSRLSAEYGKALASGRAASALSGAKGSLGADSVRNTQLELAKLREQYSLVKSSGELSARDLGIAQANYRRSVEATLAKLRELRSVNAAPVKSQLPAVADPALQNLGINKLKELRFQLATANADYIRLTRSGVLSASERAVAETQYRRKVDESRKAISALIGEQQKGKTAPGGSLGSSAISSFGLGGALGVAGGLTAATAVFGTYVKASDAVKKMDAQLRLATDSQQQFAFAQNATREIAQRSQAPLADVTTLYSRLAPAIKAMGRGQGDTVKVIDAVTQSLRISGATASETSSTITQFSQALGSGVLRGEEFNSLAENSPRLLRALADGLKVPTGALRNMAAQGQLTAEVITGVLIDALPQLQKEAELLPQTVGGAFTVMTDKINLALGTVNTQPLIDQMKRLGDAAADPETASNLNTFGTALLKLGEWGIKGVSGFVNAGKELGYVAARATGSVTELDKVEREIDAIQDALKNGGTFANIFFTQGELQEKLKLAQDFRTSLIENSTGMTAEQLAIQEQSKTDLNAVDEEKLSAARAHSAQLTAVQTQLVSDTEKALKAQVAAERTANSDLKKAKAQQLETQKKYTDALAGLQGGSTGEATYGNAQALKVGARQALANGDLDEAKKKADAALEVIKKMADAGQNTLGFSGFIKELQAIEAKADSDSVAKADDKLKGVKAQTADLNAELDKLKEIQISPILSAEAVALITKQMNDLKIKLGLPMVVPLTVQPTPEQLAAGGQVTNDAAIKFPTSPDKQVAQTVATSAPTDEVQVKPLKYKAGVSSYSQDQLRVEVEPVLAEDYYDKIVREVAQRGTLPVTVQPVIDESAVGKLDVPVKPQLDQQSVEAAQGQIDAIAEQYRQRLVIPVTVVAPGTSTAAPTDGPTIPGFATGDLVRGPGTGSSDSILARLSNGEFVMRAAAVQHYGPELLRQINERRLPRFAEGGPVGNRFLPHIPAPSQSMLNQINPVAPEPMGHVSMNVGGETYHLQAPQQDFERLIRNQRIKFGKS